MPNKRFSNDESSLNEKNKNDSQNPNPMTSTNYSEISLSLPIKPTMPANILELNQEGTSKNILIESNQNLIDSIHKKKFAEKCLVPDHIELHKVEAVSPRQHESNPISKKLPNKKISKDEIQHKSDFKKPQSLIKNASCDFREFVKKNSRTESRSPNHLPSSINNFSNIKNFINKQKQSLIAQNTYFFLIKMT